MFTAIWLSLLLAAAPQPSWHIQGNVSEACTCSPPCTCNFGQGASPHPFCYALFCIGVRRGSYGHVRLDGLKLVGVNGPRGSLYFVDDSATADQADALQQIGLTIWRKAFHANNGKDPDTSPGGYHLLGFPRAHIEQTVGPRSNHVLIEGAGGFDADYLVGIDGKSPQILLNNYNWNIRGDIKAKTRELKYKDSFGNEFDFKGTNSNQGTFDWTDRTAVYYR